ncbi:MAG: zinc-ribbon domain-containing protein, partial [Pseudomonadota bacterium]
MIIECSNCKKRYKIQEDRLQEGRIFNFSCKNCSAKIHLDLSKTPVKTESLPVSETGQKDLKDEIL